MKKSAADMVVELSPGVVDYLKVRDGELTRRIQIVAERDVAIARVENFAAIMLAAIEQQGASRTILIEATSTAMRDAIQYGNTEVALELAKVLAQFGNITATVADEYVKLTGRPPLIQS